MSKETRRVAKKVLSAARKLQPLPPPPKLLSEGFLVFKKVKPKKGKKKK